MSGVELGGLRYPWDEAPAEGEAIEVAEGVLWMRLPLPMVLNHVNIYALDEGDHWTIIDAGMKTKHTIEIWQKLLAGPLAGKPVGRVILTHYHPDHVGMVGWFLSGGKGELNAELLTTRTSWLTARMLILDVEDKATPEAKEFWRRAGMDSDLVEEKSKERPFNFADVAYPLPVGYTRIVQGDVIRAGGRNWDIHIGNGHAAEHLTMWSQDDNLVLAGDQILPSISPNIGVHATEPMADPLADWLESCERLSTLAREDHLVLGGHKLPFTGLPRRMRQLIENHDGGLKRLIKHLETPRLASECFSPLFKRKIDHAVYGMALSETIAHLNYLLYQGDATREMNEDGAWVWQANR